jgi:hypothetical protein
MTKIVIKINYSAITALYLLLIVPNFAELMAQNSLKMTNDNVKMVFNKAGELDIKPSENSSKNDFDFLVGKWHIHNKKLKSRLNHCTEWLEFEATHEMRKVLTGTGNVENIHIDFDGVPYEGMAVRLFNPLTKLWSIYWSDNNSGTLDKPVVGSFDGFIGTFYCTETHNGKPIIVQFRWDVSNPEKPTWSQAFSADNGQTWEWNWYMSFTKRTEKTELGLAANQPVEVIELRNYLLKQGERTHFGDYFDKNLVAPQNEIGGYVLGQYSVKGAEDNFFWIRGFKDMPARHQFLNHFYYGTEWKKHRNNANALLLNNDNVHLLKPLHLTDTDPLHINSNWFAKAKGIAVIDYYISNQKCPKLIDFIKTQYLSILKNVGVEDITFWVSETRDNEFPQLPVFQDKNLLVSIGFYENESVYLSKMKAIDAQMNDLLKTEMMDLVTTKSTIILYPMRK